MGGLNLYVVSGVLGMTLVVNGLWRTSSGRWRHTNAWYELDMIIGASLIIVYQLYVKAYVTLPINIFLVVVSFRGLSSFAERYAQRQTRTNRKRKKHSKKY